MKAKVISSEIIKDRSSVLEIHGKEYELVLTTFATKEIIHRYGGLDKVGEKLQKAKTQEEALDEVIWLVTLLANQPILLRNEFEGAEEELLTERKLELCSTPGDLYRYKNAITSAILKGSARNVESEESESKNTQDE